MNSITGNYKDIVFTVTRRDLQTANMPLNWWLWSVCLSITKKKKDSKNHVLNPIAPLNFKDPDFIVSQYSRHMNNVLMVFIMPSLF